MDVLEIQSLVERYGPWAVGAGSTLDNTGLPIFFVLGMGLSHAVGARPETMLAAAVAGSIIGDLGTYVIGRYFLTKDRILLGSIGHRFAPILKAGESVMFRWGFLSILLGRFVPYLGKILPLLAGSYRMSWARAVTAIVIGSALLMGFFYLYADSAYQVITGNTSAAKIASLAIGTALVILLFRINHKLEKRATPEDAGRGAGARGPGGLS